MSKKHRRRKPRKAKQIKHITNYIYIDAPPQPPQEAQRELTGSLVLYWQIVELLWTASASGTIDNIAQCIL